MKKPRRSNSDSVTAEPKVTHMDVSLPAPTYMSSSASSAELYRANVKVDKRTKNIAKTIFFMRPQDEAKIAGL